MSQKIFFTNNVGKTLEQLHDKLAPSKTMILTDNNVDEQYVTPILSPVLVGGPLEDIDIMSINPGEEHKNIDEVKNVWKFFEEYGMTRSSLLINIGGGVITDMGGFAASCYKRGIRFINVPTTILGAVDAAVGGKTGVDFNGFKNEIGVFNEAEAVIISSWVFESLPHQERLSGFAEMMKHAMLSSAEDFDEILKINVIDNDFYEGVWLPLLEKSVGVKRRIVKADPTEKGLRKALNLGHTAGHAFESFALKGGNPIPHGYAVAWGLVVAAVLSNVHRGLPSSILYRLASFVKEKYGVFHITCDDYPELLEFMHHDKKNLTADTVRFTLLSDLGSPEIDCSLSDEEISVGLDVFRDLFGI